MGKSNIDWGILGLRTWNPVTGCPRGCSYCVVRNRVWPRVRHVFGGHDYNEVMFHPERLEEPLKRKKPSTFFVGFYSDCEYWREEFWVSVLSVCRHCPQHTFMFLTKGYNTYYDMSINFEDNGEPENIVCGVTLTGEQDEHQQFNYMLNLGNNNRSFLSIEPLLGLVKPVFVNSLERVIVGAMTGRKAIPPKPEWIQSVKDNVPPDKIYWKANIRKYL